MKKMLASFFVLLLMGFLAACGETSTEDKDVSNVESSGKENTSSTDGEKEDAEENKELNQAIADTENIKATLVSVQKKNDEIFGDTIEVKFEVENKRDDTIEVQAREVSADGKMIDETMLVMSQQIAPGKLADCVLTIQNLEGGDLPSMEENLEMILHVFSWDNMDFEEQHNVKIEF